MRTSRFSGSLLLSLAMLLSLSNMPSRAVTTDDGSASEKADKDAMPEIKYELEKQPLVEHPGGSSHEVTAKNFPISKGIAGVSMHLNPGGLRELHWHANAAEWAYVITGHCRVTIIDPQGRTEIKDFGPGDVWYFPRGHAHSIQGLGPGDCHFILAFDNGYFSEFGTFSISDWIAQTPPEVLGKNFGVSPSLFANFPKKEVYISQGPVPPPLPQDPALGSENPPPLTHRFRLGAKEPVKVAGSTFNVVDQSLFPISTTVSGAILVMQPQAIRLMHWHPNADEWQYYIRGHARVTVFGSQGRKITREFGPGDVGYVPMGYGHYLETVGDEECEMLAVFNSGTYQEISLAEWVAKTPKLLLQTNFNQPANVIDAIRKGQNLFSDPKSFTP